MDDDIMSAPPGEKVLGKSSSSPEDAGVVAVEDIGEGAARWERAAGLFKKWCDGEAQAVDELVRLMTPVLWHVVRAYGLRRSIAEEVVQTTWLTLVNKYETIDEPAAVAGWLTITARREAWRAARADGRSDMVDDEQLEASMPTHRPAEEEAAQADESAKLWAAVSTLDGRCRQLLRVVAFDDRPDYARIASDLHMAVGSIGPTRQRCLSKLRARLEEIGIRPVEAA